MSQENIHETERQLNAELHALGPMLDAPCPEALRDRLKTAVRFECAVQGSAEQADARLAPETLDRIRRAVRAELAAMADQPVRPGSRLVYRLRTVASVAAVLAFAVGLFWYAVRPQVDPRPTEPIYMVSSRTDPVELFAEAAERLWDEDPLIAELSWEVQSLEYHLAHLPGEDGVERMLDHIDDHLEEIFVDWVTLGWG
jgi:hypothetical protein